MDQGSLEQIVHGGLLLYESDQIAHVILQLLPANTGVLHPLAHDIDRVMPVIISRQQTVLLRQKFTYGSIVEPEDILLGNRMGGIADKLQSLFHSVDAVFTLISGGISGHDFPDAVP